MNSIGGKRRENGQPNEREREKKLICFFLYSWKRIKWQQQNRNKKENKSL
jgi:hypothetical protein